MTPASRRVAAAAPSGALAGNPLDLFKEALSGRMDDFVNWRREPFTRLVARVLQQFSLAGVPAGSGADAGQLLVQYGVTVGLNLALQVMNDPSVLWPEAFGPREAGGAPAVPDMDFATSLDDVLGGFADVKTKGSLNGQSVSDN